MRNLRSAAQEASEDIFFGQVVINWARWFIIVAGALLVIWTAGSPADLVIGVIPVVALMAVNFYLHGRHIAERPANLALISLASILDLAVITVVVVFWPTETHRGLASPFFIMFYPMVLAFAFVMPPRMAVVYTVASVAAYAGACILVGVPVVTDDSGVTYTSVFSQTGAVKVLVARIITLGAMGALGTYYWRIQRNRRRAALGEPSALLTTPGEA